MAQLGYFDLGNHAPSINPIMPSELCHIPQLYQFSDQKQVFSVSLKYLEQKAIFR